MDTTTFQEVKFPDIDGWRAVCAVKTFPLSGGAVRHAYSIYDKQNKYVAFLCSDGTLNIIGKESTFYPVERKFNPKTAIKQAVRYSYVMLQKVAA